MSFLNRLTDLGKSIAFDALRSFTSSLSKEKESHPRASSSKTSHGKKTSSSRGHSPSKKQIKEPSAHSSPSFSSLKDSGKNKGTLTAASPADFPGPDEAPKVYDFAALGRPSFHYRPDNDSQPDPGEVVWAWIPYEEDRSRGKDRPVVVVAEAGDCVVVAQLTSKDHDRDAHQEAFYGRYWYDIGTGPWDPQGRPSEVRLDRLLVVHPSQVRRQGGSLDKTRFTQVIRAIESLHS